MEGVNPPKKRDASYHSFELHVITPLTALKLSLACSVDNSGNPRTTEVLIDERLTECNASLRTLKYFEE
mgnify:FL=1